MPGLSVQESLEKAPLDLAVKVAAGFVQDRVSELTNERMLVDRPAAYEDLPYNVGLDAEDHSSIGKLPTNPAQEDPADKPDEWENVRSKADNYLTSLVWLFNTEPIHPWYKSVPEFKTFVDENKSGKNLTPGSIVLTLGLLQSNEMPYSSISDGSQSYQFSRLEDNEIKDMARNVVIASRAYDFAIEDLSEDLDPFQRVYEINRRVADAIAGEISKLFPDESILESTVDRLLSVSSKMWGGFDKVYRTVVDANRQITTIADGGNPETEGLVAALNENDIRFLEGLF